MRYIITMGIILLSLWGAQPAYKADISADRLARLKAQGAEIIDIRTPPEWGQTGVIEGSHTITFFDERGQYNIGRFMMQLGMVTQDKSDPLIIICRTGSRSVPVADFLARSGFTNVYNQKRGIVEWLMQKRPVVRP